MRQRSKVYIVVGSFAVVLLLLVVALVVRDTTSTIFNAENSTLLVRPPFINIARAAEDEVVSEIGDKLDAEAGISAYFKSPTPIDLDIVRGQFRTIEIETGDYIVGSVAVPNYQEHYDTHVYVHRDGWILAYYLNDTPVGKMVDIRAQDIQTTILKNVVAAIAGVAGAPFTDLSYYDFRYPNATNILFVAEDDYDGNDFNIELPTGFAYAELSLAIINTDCCGMNFYVDGASMPLDYGGSNIGYGTLAISDLLPGSSHVISVDNYGVLVIVYREP